jgi:uncharacterized protein (TIGR00255 family)
MAKSMTGFGKASTDFDGECISVEVTSVNHRFLDCSYRTPSTWNALEPSLREVVQEKVGRGKLSVFVNRKRGSNSRHTVHIDTEVAQQYVQAARELSNLMNTTEALSLNVLAQMEGVLCQEEREDDLEQLRAIAIPLLTDALVQLNEQRTAEGARLAAEMRAQVAEMKNILETVQVRIPEINEAYQARLRARMQELNVDAAVSEERLSLELAVMSDKADVTEEIVRLESHFVQAEDLLDCTEPIGRELNFLAQEMQREINTLGSKLRDIQVARDVLRLKSALEKLREQAQNIE